MLVAGARMRHVVDVALFNQPCRTGAVHRIIRGYDMKGIKFKLSSGAYVTFFAETFVIIESPNGKIRIDDLVHGNGGWELDGTYTYSMVLDCIKGATK